MVTISHMVTLQYKEEKAIIVPTELTIQHEEHQYIQLRPTNHAICQLVCGSNMPKNASISACTKLQEVIQKRNHAMQSDEASEPQDDLFPSSDEPPSKKKKGMKIPPPTVNITVGEVTVTCLVHGRRPTASDLCIRLDATQIGAIVDYIREDAIEAMQQSKRKYVKKVSPSIANMAVPESIVFEVQTIMDGEMPLNSKTEAILACLENAGLASKQRLLPRHLLIHPDNRSQSMLSYHDVWSKRLAMSMVGFNIKLVEGTTIAFTMSTEPEKRAMQLAKNKALIDNAMGHLAPMNGSEGYLTIGGSHTVAYLRCIENGVTGPSAESSTHPKSDAIWRAISDGWTWVTISSAVEDAIPILPSFLQSSLNSANSIQKNVSELEVAMLLATCFAKGMTLAQAVKHAEHASQLCRTSISAIGTYVMKFSGHAGSFPILHFLSNFSKVHSSSMLLGEDMMTQIATMDFKSSTNMYPMTRAAIWLTLLACPKNHERDGFARNLIRSDIERLKQAACLPMTTKAEQMLQDAWGIHQSIHAGQGKHIDGHHVDNCFGRLCIRTILHLCNKAKTDSRECKEFASLEAIVEAFSTELYKDSPASGAEASKSDEKPMVDVLSAKPHVVALLQNAHMTMGGRYTNSKEHGSMVFILQSVSDDGACMRHTPFFGDSIDISVPLESLKKWRSTKTPMPKLCDVTMVTTCMPNVHPAFVEEHQRAMVTVALHAAHKKHSSTSSLAFGQFPPSLMTMVTCKKKAGIKLTPMGNISKHKAEGAPKGTALEAFGSHWVSPPKQNTLFEDEKHPLVPYFWVRACASDAQPNMSFSTIVQDGVRVPMLYEKHEVLLHPPMEETMQEPPKKKAKAKAEAN
ncbi:unnamed protein product [Symbiodinium sp. CCMP2592]|nr:unnamed protein product [Symbiodinium sp. CCMP2592]